MDEQILNALRVRIPVVTAGDRLARSLRREYATLQTGQGAAVWETPAVLSWKAWLGALWEEHQCGAAKPPVLLDEWQEWALWDGIIRRSPQANALLQAGAAATAVQSSWALAVQWRLDAARIEAEGNEDARTFAQWARQFRETCRKSNWIDRASMPDRLAGALDEARLAGAVDEARLAGAVGELRLPPALLLAGFEEFTPQQADFLEACRRAGCDVRRVDAEAAVESAHAVRAPFADSEQELLAAARWARQLLEANPAANIGVVVPDLEARRGAVERTFRAILEPASQMPGAEQVSRLVNFSAGMPLAGYPLVRSALAILGLSAEHSEWDEISSLLRDRYVGGAESERSPRGALDARLRRHGRTQVSLAEVTAEARRESSPCPVLVRSLQRWLRARDTTPDRQTAACWAATFSGMLEAMGWPGEQPLHSVEFQTVEAWKAALSTLAGTDFIAGNLSLEEALARLARIAAGARFQPESPDAPVQVLGALEAMGLRFDHLWVTGLTDETWPGPPSPDPFLPIRMQREAEVPRCSPERELAFAELVTERLLTSAPEIVLSHPTHDGDRALAVSPLIQTVTAAAPETLPASETSTCVRAIQASHAVEQLVDKQGPPLGEEAWARGGARVFQHQAACPFRAFAELRLGAEDLEVPTPGLDAKERGTLIHAALEEFWKEVRTQAALCALADLPAVVRQAVARAVAHFEDRRGAPLPERFAELERERLEEILCGWLELEKRRGPFEVIQPEEERTAEVGGIRFKVKIDRIDRISGERDLIIDYKTNKPNIKSWEGERPDEPQLPLYSVVYGKPLAGLLFGQLKTGELKFKGVVDAGVSIPGAEPGELGERIAEWRVVMERLAAEFRSGHAEPDPKLAAKTCRYCPLPSLCRIAEGQAEWNAADESEASWNAEEE